MCQKKPGPRCSKHAAARLQSARAALKTARAEGDTESTQSALRVYREARDEYDTTPAGQKELTTEIEALTEEEERLSQEIDALDETATEADVADRIRSYDQTLRQKNQLSSRLAVGTEVREGQVSALRQAQIESGERKVRLYRTGSLKAAVYTGEIAEHADRADAARPEGHFPRHGSLYASPEIKGVARWVKGNNFAYGRRADYDGSIHEIAVAAPGLYVYSVRAWEGVSWHDKDPSTYWESAVPLSQWERVSKERNLDPSEWEVLLPPDDSIMETRPCSARRVLNAAIEGKEYGDSELERIAKWEEGEKRWAAQRAKRQAA